MYLVKSKLFPLSKLCRQLLVGGIVWLLMIKVLHMLGLYLHTAPLCHIDGLSSAMAMLMVGGCHVLMPEFEARLALEAIDKHEVTYLITVPAMLADMLSLISYIDDLTRKMRQNLVVELEAKVNRKVQENMTMLLKKLGEANPGMKLDVKDFCATVSSDGDDNGTPMTSDDTS